MSPFLTFECSPTGQPSRQRLVAGHGVEPCFRGYEPRVTPAHSPARFSGPLLAPELPLQVHQHRLFLLLAHPGMLLLRRRRNRERVALRLLLRLGPLFV